MQVTRDGFRLSDDPAAFDAAAAHGLLATSTWSPGIPLATVAAAARGSWTFSLRDREDRFVGMARLVTDRATFAYLCDVIVEPALRGKGFGLWMLQEIHALPELAGLRRLMLATADMHPLYRKLGYQDISDASRLMQILRPGIYAAP